MSNELQPEEDNTATAEFYQKVFAGKPDPAAAIIGNSIADAKAQREAEVALERSRTTARPRHRRAPWDITGSPAPDGTRLMSSTPEEKHYYRSELPGGGTPPLPI